MSDESRTSKSEFPNLKQPGYYPITFTRLPNTVISSGFSSLVDLNRPAMLPDKEMCELLKSGPFPLYITNKSS